MTIENDILLLKREQLQALNDAHAVVKLASSEKRGLNPLERESYEKAHTQANALDDLQQKLVETETSQRAASHILESKLPKFIESGGRESPEIATMIRAWANGDAQTRATTNAANIFTTGGALIAPKQMASDILRSQVSRTVVRNIATVIPLENTDTLGVISLDTELSDSTHSNEASALSAANVMEFGQREMRLKPLTQRINVYNSMLRGLNGKYFYDFLVNELGKVQLLTQEKNFITGSSATSALGVMTPTAFGVPTSRDTTTAGATAITYGDLWSLRNSLHENYDVVSTIAHRTVLTAIGNILDLNLRPIFLPSTEAASLNAPLGRLFGTQVYTSAYMPSTITSGLYTLVMGDFSKYWIVEDPTTELSVNRSAYEADQKTAFFITSRYDGQPVLAEAFARLKQA